MIPASITHAHVIAAMAAIDREGVPRGRHSRGFELIHEGCRYPPKYTVALAAQFATGTFLDSERFGGGAETNGFLERLGFTVVPKGSTAPETPRPASTRTVRVGRVFLDLGIRQSAYRARPEGKAMAFHNLAHAQFPRAPEAYLARIVGLIRVAHEAGATVVALPAYACQVFGTISLERYGVPEVALVLAGGLDDHGEFAVAFRHGIPCERFGPHRVHWLGADGFSVMAAISSTIGQLIDSRYQPPKPSQSHPPDAAQPVLVIDMGHAQYASRYDFNTLRCVARDVATRTSQPVGLVLSSWMWTTRGISTGWCHPPARARGRRILVGPDALDLVEVDLGARRTGADSTKEPR
ncbi:MAG: hypothetical protein H6742_15300 [Alphaproteobacteria bacterium]|nr:hypothetical protein [Alphaproteobacteria bacterium]